MIPVQFTQDFPDATQRVGSYIRLPKHPVARNVETKMDDLGLYADMTRGVGESTANFRTRLLNVLNRRPGVDHQHLTDGLCLELGLGQTYLMSVRVDQDARLHINQLEILIDISGAQHVVPLVNLAIDGFWDLPTLSGVAVSLNEISGVVATTTSGFDTFPAILLEPQDSFQTVTAETVPQAAVFDLGFLSRQTKLAGPPIVSSILFTDTETYRVYVSGTPSIDGEWTVDAAGRVTSFTIPVDTVRVAYQYNLLPSGATMRLVGNGLRIVNTASPETQDYLVSVSGIGEMGKEVFFEVDSVDRMHWGR